MVGQWRGTDAEFLFDGCKWYCCNAVGFDWNADGEIVGAGRCVGAVCVSAKDGCEWGGKCDGGKGVV